MIKTKKKSMYMPLITAGYILFALLVIGVLISTTIPMGVMLFDPRVIHYNVAVIAIALTVGAILPVLLAYIIGDTTVKSKSKAQHHFNGMLFGLLAYWLMTIPMLFFTIPEVFGRDYATRALVLNLSPSILIALVTAVVAFMHLRSKSAKRDAIEYKPFSLLLIGGVVLLHVWSVVHSIATNTVSVYTFIFPVATLLLGALSYASLKRAKLSTYMKVVWAAVSISVLFVALYVSNQFIGPVADFIIRMPTMEAQTVINVVAALLALAGWLVYWIKQRRVLIGK